MGGRERESIFSPRKLYAYHDLALLLHPSGLCLILHLSLSLSLTHSLTNKRSETTKFTLHYISFSLSLFPYTVLAQDYPQHNSLSQISGKQLFRNTITKVHPCLNINVSKFPRFWKLWERKSSNKR